MTATRPHMPEQAALYALDILDEDDVAAFETHLDSCPQCQETVRCDRETLRRLIVAAPEMDASPGFKERLLASAVESPDPALGFKERLLKRAAEETNAPPSLPPTPVATPRLRLLRPRSWRSPWLVAPIAAVLAVLVGFGALLNAWYGGQVVSTIPLSGQVAAGAAMVVQHRSGAAELRLEGLANPPPGRVYEGWVIAAGSPPVPVGVLASGTGQIPLPPALQGKTVALTVEPSPGSAAPTTTPFLLAEVTS